MTAMRTVLPPISHRAFRVMSERGTARRVERRGRANGSDDVRVCTYNLISEDEFASRRREAEEKWGSKIELRWGVKNRCNKPTFGKIVWVAFLRRALVLSYRTFGTVLG